MRFKGILALTAACLLAVPTVTIMTPNPVVEASKHEAGLQAKDFSCRGVALGDDESKLKKAFGEPVFDKNMSVYGLPVRQYVYKDGFTVKVNAHTNRVVDIVIRNKTYKARNDIRYGSTPYWLQKTYGDGERQLIEGVIYQVYTRQDEPHERLLCELDPEDSSLRTMRITALPLNEDEADAWAVDGQDDLADDPQQSLWLSEKTIDTSNLPQAETPKLKEVGK